MEDDEVEKLVLAQIAPKLKWNYMIIKSKFEKWIENIKKRRKIGGKDDR